MQLRLTMICIVLLPMFLPGNAHSEDGKIRLALLPANDRDRVLNREILESTAQAFFRTKRFTLAERHQLNKIIEEKSLKGFVGALNGNPSAAGLEKLTDIDMIGIVNYTKEQAAKDLPVAYWINVRLVSVESSEIFAIIDNRRADLLTPSTPHEAAELLFRSIREQFPPQGYILKIRDDKIYVDIGKEVGLKNGDTLEIFEEGEIVFSERTGKPVQIEGGVIGTLKIIRVANGSSQCKIKKSSRPLTTIDTVRLKATDHKLLAPINKLRNIFRRREELEN